MRRRRALSGFLSAGTALAIGCGCAVWGAYGLAQSNAVRPVVTLAKRIERGETGTENVRVAGVSLPEAVRSSSCVPKILRSELTLRLHELDYLRSLPFGSPGASQESLHMAHVQALEAANRLLVCAPADGNAWLRKAMVENAMDGPGESVFRSLENSLKFAPHEARIARIRRRYAGRLKAVGVDHEVLDRILDHTDAGAGKR